MIHIISDLHLSQDRADLTALFAKYMQDIATKSKQLYVLGDLFEVWIGDDCLENDIDFEDSTFYQSVISQFKNYSDNIGELFFMHGNRDFLLGEKFEKATGGKILPEPFFFYHNDKQTAFMHGDSLCTDDKEYQEFRTMVRNPVWQKEFLSLPKEKRIEIASGLRKQSKDAQKDKTSEIMDVNQDSVIEFIKENNIVQLIHGHTHRQDIHYLKIADKKTTRHVLADWGNRGFYLELNSNEISENYFS
ncbi:MAG: UDP-2,3-diacylglucosamine diphosphatase [Gammaproteobacteria bacterium]|nr:MAG: UDP-2,3-diacylglucosamine diphosphatase [Gammaproteobacteria bacterium]